MPWLDDLITVLEDASVGTRGENLFVSSRAAIPHLASGAATCQLIETGGTSPEGTQNATLTPAYIQPACQLTFRANSYVAARTMAAAAYAALFKIRNQFINSGWYKWIKPLQEPADIGLDTTGQARIVFNVIANKRP